MKRKLVWTIIVTGFSGLVAQILLLREFLIVFLGNELSIGIILSNWLILEAAGAYLAGKIIEKSKRKTEVFVIFLLVFSLFLPLSVYFIRVLKSLLGVIPGEALGLGSMLLSSLFLLLPVSLPHGALFTVGCKIFSQVSSGGRITSVGKVYILETLGTIAGGIILTCLLIPFLHSFQICFGVSLINFILASVLLGNFLRKNLGYKIIGSFSLLLLVLFSLVSLPSIDSIHRISVDKQWPGQEVSYYHNSIYGNVAVAKREEQLTFFSNGVPIFSSPTPDIIRVEEFAHFPMLTHSSPRDILILSGGVGGLIKEVLKHPSVKRIDYAELDPLLLEVVRDFPTSLTQAELNDPRVRIAFTDGRFFIKKTPDKYDLIFVGLDLPLDLQVNRLFTEQFFKESSGKLKGNGILVLSLPGSLTYLSKELRNLNSCIINTLKEVYPYTRVIPGDGTNIYLASHSSYILETSPSILNRRLNQRNIKTRVLTLGHFEYRLAPRWLDWFKDSTRGFSPGINQDFKPLGLFYALSYFSSSFTPRISSLFPVLENLNLKVISSCILIFTLLFISLSFRFRRLSKLAVPYGITTTGFAGMIFDLAIIFSFQVIYGYVFYWIGILVSVFMMGVVAGGFLSTLNLERKGFGLPAFIKLELAIIVFSLMLPFVFLFLYPYMELRGAYFVIQALFLALCFIAGFLTAAQFPLANKIYMGSRINNVGTTAGLLYCLDLLGGWLGGILGGLVLLPILGLSSSLLVIVFLKLSSLVMLVVSGRKAQTS